MDSSEIEDPTEIMPYELWYLAVENLPVKDILNLCRTSKQFAELCKTEYLWKRLLKRDFGVKWTLAEGAREEYIRLSGFSPMVSCGGNFTGFVTKDKKLYMWGTNLLGQLGIPGDFEYRDNPTFIMEDVTQVSCGTSHTGAITKGGKLYMWGENDEYQLGDGTNDTRLSPLHIDIKGRPRFIQVSCGHTHTGAVTAEGRLFAWGEIYPESEPYFIIDNMAQVSCGWNFTAAITTSGKLFVWGDNNNGILGDGTTGSKKKPTRVYFKGNPRINQVSCGLFNIGAVTEDGDLYMWGGNMYGKLGDGTTASKLIPTLIMRNIAQVSCGNDHTGAVTKDEKLYMWGNNSEGQLGDRTTIDKTKPILIDIKDVVQVSCGHTHTGVITAKGKLYTWGGLGKKKRTLIKIPKK